MGILKTILGSSDIIKQTFGFIDELHTSTEEEIAAKNKAKTDLLAAYAPFKLAQRYLALLFSTTFLVSFFLMLGMTLAGVGNTEEVLKVLNMFYLGEIMLTIIIFYFGGGFAEGALNTYRKRPEDKA